MDKEATFTKIYKEHVKKVFTYVLFRVKSKSIAEDITSDTFFKFYQELEANEEVVTYALPWLYRVAYNRLLDYVRSSKFRKSVSLDTLQETEGQVKDEQNQNILRELIKSEQMQKIYRVMSKLPEKDRAVIELRKLEMLSFKEIAVILNSSEPAVKMRYKRAMGKLIERMKNERA